jgi:TatA/E family protein of Tat protein translocase
MEVIIVFLIILLLFGAKKIPEIAQGLGRGITEFKKAARDVTDEIENAAKASPSTPRIKNELKEQKPTDDVSQQS